MTLNHIFDFTLSVLPQREAETNQHMYAVLPMFAFLVFFSITFSYFFFLLLLKVDITFWGIFFVFSHCQQKKN